MRNPLLSVLVTLSAILTALPSSFGYGDEGHETVGAIADQLIAGTSAAVHVNALLNGETLEQASIWADTAKRHFNRATNPEMATFVDANDTAPNEHHQYHYTDAPIQETRYRDTSVGANPRDVVHMIRNCIAILEGTSNARTNPTNIPPETALKLLVHYVGDIHQPLHVGAAYFGPNATLVNPNTTSDALEGRGGNEISLHGSNLHSYWDGLTVKNAMAAAGV